MRIVMKRTLQLHFNMLVSERRSLLLLRLTPDTLNATSTEAFH